MTVAYRAREDKKRADCQIRHLESESHKGDSALRFPCQVCFLKSEEYERGAVLRFPLSNLLSQI